MNSSPEEKYLHDVRYRTFVAIMEAHLHAFTYTPEEMREMAFLACIHYEIKHPYHQENINLAGAYPPDVLEALDTLVKWRQSRP